MKLEQWIFTSLPIIFWLLLIYFLSKKSPSLRKSILTASVIWGVCVTAITEILSIFRCINATSIAVSWGIVIFVIAILSSLSRQSKAANPNIDYNRSSLLIIAGILIIAALTGLVAIVAPTNNWDSMTYHMGRVVHWMQNHSVAHYPTHITRQLYNPPWAEFSILHLQLLSNGDRLANLVQWFSMLASLIGVSLIAQKLGADRIGQITASAICVAIPMGILQSNSTQNDYVVSFWLVCMVYFGLELKNEFTWPHLFATGASLGLAVLTKGTAYIFAFPLFLWFCISYYRLSTLNVLKFMGVIALMSLAMNLGHYSRNYEVFGNPLSTDRLKLTNEIITPSIIASNALRNIALNLSLPYENANNAVGLATFYMHNSIGLDLHDPRTTLGSGFGLNGKLFHEDYAGNPLHLILIVMALIIVIVSKRTRHNSNLLGMTVTLTVAFILFCTLLKWQIWGTRLQLPLFVLWSPVIGAATSLTLRRALVPISIFMVISAIPWAICNETRSIIGHANIFNTTRASLYFNSRPEIKETYVSIAQRVVKSGCKGIAMESDEDAYEYPFWVMTQEKLGVRPEIYHVNVTNRSAGTANMNLSTDCSIRL